MCKQLVSELTLEDSSWYVSPSLEQGRKEAEAIENYTDSSFSM